MINNKSKNVVQAEADSLFSIFNPGPIGQDNSNSKTPNKRLSEVCSIDVVKDELTLCECFTNTTIKRFSRPFSDDELRIIIYEEADTYIRELLHTKTTRRPQSFEKIIKIYVLLRMANIVGIFYIDKGDLRKATGGGKKGCFNLALESLESIGLIKEFVLYNNLSGRKYNAYCAYPLNIDILNRESCIDITYQATGLKKYQANKSFHIDEAFLINNDDVDTEDYTPSYKTTFTSWYNDLQIMGETGIQTPRRGHFSAKDGRFYHKFHLISRETRETYVWWDGESLVEQWDANASFFLTMSYMLMNKEFEDKHIQEKIKEEAIKMAELCLQGKFYKKVQQFYNKNAKYKKYVDDIKVLCQKYKTRWRSYYLKANGEYKNYKYLDCLKYIDMFFKEYFPYIRDYILDAEVIIEDNPNVGERQKGWNGWTYKEGKTKKVSTLAREVMPYEFKLISEGICKVLYEEYGIKSITVHDAIYMRKSDAFRCPNIDTILRRILGLPQPKPSSLFNPTFPKWEFDDESKLYQYQFNLNTPNLTQLRVW